MDFVDSTLIRLADEATRAGLFDDAALEAIAAAAYRVENLNLTGPFQALFETLQLGFAVDSIATLEGTWGPSSGSERIEAHLFLTGFGAPIQVDALWRGAIRAQIQPANSHVTAVRVQPQTLAPDFATEKVGVTYAPPGNAPPASRILPITAALFIRPVGFSLVQLLMETRRARTQIESSGLARPADPELPTRHAIVAVWVLPAAALDESFPGNAPAARRAAAAQWLAREGIGLAIIP